MASEALDGVLGTGGVPTQAQDLAPCIIFTIAYACLIPHATLRLANKASRSTLLIGPAIFIPVRIVTFILRAVQATGNDSLAVFIVIQIFLIAGFAIICDPIVALFEYHITRTHANPNEGLWTQRAIRILRLSLWATFILAIVSGARTSGAVSDPEKAEYLHKLRNVNGGMCLAIVLSIIFVTLIAHVHKNLPNRATALLVFLAGCLLVTASYRMSTIHHSFPPFAIKTKVAFYVLLVLPEWLATGALFLFPIREMFAEDFAKQKRRDWNKEEHIPLEGGDSSSRSA
ncbi:unnamed protein product [Cyclocybe aegerita]|uniref:Uncharacterized protein n=1 Tax=Cyclocybe aegerita TaxID=1973307 RepID=A0A8S0W1B2_CYCAE|nr:unnamed protein product [Cyclocybe aegerita]